MQPDKQIMTRLKPGCICKGVKLSRLIEAIKDGADSFEEVARQTGIGGGPCKGKRCGQKVKELLQKK